VLIKPGIVSACSFILLKCNLYGKAAVLFSRIDLYHQGEIMNIGIILPVNAEKRQPVKLPGFLRMFEAAILNPGPLEIQKIDIFQGLRLVVCGVPLKNKDILNNEIVGRRLRNRIRRVFEEERAWPLLEHPEIKGLYGLPDYSFDDVVGNIIIKRFPDVLFQLRGVGDLSRKEITITGDSAHLEYAIKTLITKVKTLNILLAENSSAPHEAEQAFLETGIPVHITTDPDVLNRSAVWIRFPNDYAGFDELPQKYNGIIIDLEAARVVDTKCKKIYRIVVEFSERIKNKIGCNILDGWKEGYLEGAVIAVCSSMWDVSIYESSDRLGMLLSFKA